MRPHNGNPRRALWYLIPFLVFMFFNQIIGLVADWVGSKPGADIGTVRIGARLSLLSWLGVF